MRRRPVLEWASRIGYVARGVVYLSIGVIALMAALDKTPKAAGAVGDVLGNYVDIEGHPLHSPETGRLVGLTLAELNSIGSVVAVVSEREKPMAILGVLRTRAVDVLVLDEDNARFLLECEPALPMRPGSEV